MIAIHWGTPVEAFEEAGNDILVGVRRNENWDTIFLFTYTPLRPGPTIVTWHYSLVTLHAFDIFVIVFKVELQENVFLITVYSRV